MNNIKLFRPASRNVKDKALGFISHYFPDLLEDIQQYAEQQGVDKGDIAVLTITEIIIPELERLG